MYFGINQVFVKVSFANQNKVKPVSVVEIYAIKFSHSLILLKIWENFMSIEKMRSNKSQKSLSQQLLFKVSLFQFDFVSAFQYLDCCYNEYPVKQTTSLYLKLPLKPAFFFFFSLFLLFLES